ncbi:MAG TPA: hypothetical protein PLJ34_10475, partial [Hyphomicrobiales bacterium]|nr:hypothetical protein [Hyphomicrobiales bacterium]
MKFDRQIVAISLVNGARVLYSDDDDGFPFGIDGEGETIVLSDADLNTVESLFVPRLDSDHSYGPSADAGPGFFYYDTPTPGAENTSATYFGYAPAPVFSKPAG